MKVSGIPAYHTNTNNCRRQNYHKSVMFGDLIRNDSYYKTVPMSEENKILLQQTKKILKESNKIFNSAFDKFINNFIEERNIVPETSLYNPEVSHITSKSYDEFSKSFLPTYTLDDRSTEIKSYYLANTKTNKVLVLTDNEIADNNNEIKPGADLNREVQEGLKAIIETHKSNSSYQSV